MKPTKEDKKLLKKYKDLNGKQRNIVRRLLNDSDEWLKIRTLLKDGEVSTEQYYKQINKFDPHLEPLENYQLIVDYVTAVIRYWGTLEGEVR